MSDDPYLKTCRYKFCEESFMARRLNQEYCSWAHKVKQNNWIARQERISTKGLDNISHSNRKILKHLYASGIISVTYKKLKGLGFIIDFYTHVKKDNESNNRILFFYEYGLVPDDPDNYKIIKENE